MRWITSMRRWSRWTYDLRQIILDLSSFSILHAIMFKMANVCYYSLLFCQCWVSDYSSLAGQLRCSISISYGNRADLLMLCEWHCGGAEFTLRLNSVYKCLHKSHSYHLSYLMIIFSLNGQSITTKHWETVFFHNQRLNAFPYVEAAATKTS